MKKIIKSPAPQLSQLKEFTVDLDMTGRHYALLACSKGQIPEDIALSITKDLMQEDAGKLTMAELRYVFMLIKINSMENSYNVDIECTHEGCSHINHYSIKLSDADLNSTPRNYKVPKVKFTDENGEKEYFVMPPTMDMESALYNWFIVTKGKSLDDLVDDKETALNYTFIRSVMHLIDKDGKRLVNELNDFEYVLKYFDTNKYSDVSKLYELVEEVDSFGVQNKIYKFKCKECGGTLIFRLPMLHGLIGQ